MKFIVDTQDLDMSKSMIEMVLENEFAYPFVVNEINHPICPSDDDLRKIINLSWMKLVENKVSTDEMIGIIKEEIYGIVNKTDN